MTPPATEVLACVDFSGASIDVAEQAVRLARAFGGGVHLLHVAAPEPEIAGYDKDPIANFTRRDRAEQLVEEHRQLRELAASLGEAGVKVVPLVVMGDTVSKILEEAARVHAAVIVIGSHGHGGLHQLLLGSVSEAVIRHSTRPVMIVPTRRD
ncbi:MAG: universal stress protein [Acidimicrobiales bacterium]|nr:universal stress protein [Acidimicrobiales bacterium]